MAYSDYGGYAYRNGKRVEARSDATISPEGDVFGSPGMWPGFAAYAAGGKDEYEKRRDWPSGHAVLGDGPIYVVLYKQSSLSIYRGPELLDEVTLLKDMPPEAVETWEWDGKSGRSLNTDHFKSTGDRCVFEVDGWRLVVFFRIEDNHYQYAKLTQPDGNVWHGWSGYGVGAGLEDCGYGYSTEEREDVLRELWPESIAGLTPGCAGQSRLHGLPEARRSSGPALVRPNRQLCSAPAAQEQTMIDRELLEKAATAAGWRVVRAADYYEGGDGAVMLHGIQEPWNPLGDDGDALRLAVRVNLGVCIAAPITYARMAMQEGISAPISEFHSGDAMAATRRAIVRAAAAMALSPAVGAA